MGFTAMSFHRIAASRMARNALMETENHDNNSDDHVNNHFTNPLVVIIPEPVLTEPDGGETDAQPPTAPAPAPADSTPAAPADGTTSSSSPASSSGSTATATTVESSAPSTELDTSASASSHGSSLSSGGSNLLYTVLLPIGCVAVLVVLLACGYAMRGYMQKRHERQLQLMLQAIPIGEQADCENVLVLTAPVSTTSEMSNDDYIHHALTEVQTRPGRNGSVTGYAAEGDGRTESLGEAVVFDSAQMMTTVPI
jgi:hypothetical protein